MEHDIIWHLAKLKNVDIREAFDIYYNSKLANQIAEIVKKLAADKKADFILEKGVCHFADPKADLTDELIKRINASAPSAK